MLLAINGPNWSKWSQRPSHEGSFLQESHNALVIILPSLEINSGDPETLGSPAYTSLLRSESFGPLLWHVAGLRDWHFRTWGGWLVIVGFLGKYPASWCCTIHLKNSNNFTPDQAIRAENKGLRQPAGQKLLNFLRQSGVAVVCFSPVCIGMFVGGIQSWKKRTRWGNHCLLL